MHRRKNKEKGRNTGLSQISKGSGPGRLEVLEGVLGRGVTLSDLGFKASLWSVGWTKKERLGEENPLRGYHSNSGKR